MQHLDFIIIIGISVVALIAIIELPVICTLGLPILRKNDADSILTLLPNASLNSYNRSILSFYPQGYISTCEPSPCGSTYFSNGGRIIRIPWWTPLYKEVKAKYAELNSSEK